MVFLKKEYLEAGKIVGTHGIRGTLRLNPWADSSDSVCSYKRFFIDGDKKELSVVSAKPHGAVALIDISGVDSIEKAESLRGKTFYIKREDAYLPEGRYFIDELKGCKVFDFSSGKPLGVLSDVSSTGANDVWHIEQNGKEYLIPVIDDVVKEVDIENEIIKISPLKGIFDDEN